MVSIDEAVDRAGVPAIALWLDAFEQLIGHYGGRLGRRWSSTRATRSGPTAPAATERSIGEQESSGEHLGCGGGARVVKVFGTLSAPVAILSGRREARACGLSYAADDARQATWPLT